MRQTQMKARTRSDQAPILMVRAASSLSDPRLLTARLLVIPVFLGVVVAASGSDKNHELAGRSIERPVSPALSSRPLSFPQWSHGGSPSTR